MSDSSLTHYLSTRARNALHHAGIERLEDTDDLTDEELLDIRNLGAVSALEIRTLRLRQSLARPERAKQASDRRWLSFLLREIREAHVKVRLIEKRLSERDS